MKKIRDTWKRIEECHDKSNKKGDLKIYAIKTYPTRSIFISEHCLVETPYQTASGRANIPVFIYRKVARLDSPYSFAQSDIEALRVESKLIKEINSATP